MLIVLSPTVWVDLLHNAGADLPAAQPGDRLDAAQRSSPASSRRSLTREPDAEAKFDDEKLRTYLGVGAE